MSHLRQLLIEVTDVEAFAFSAGFVCKGRNIRSWEERVKALASLGFIKVAPNGTKKQGYRSAGCMRQAPQETLPDLACAPIRPLTLRRSRWPPLPNWLVGVVEGPAMLSNHARVS